ARHHVGGAVGDPLHAPGVPAGRVHQAQAGEPEVLHGAHGGGGVHVVLGLPEHHHDPVEHTGRHVPLHRGVLRLVHAPPVAPAAHTACVRPKFNSHRAARKSR